VIALEKHGEFNDAEAQGYEEQGHDQCELDEGDAAVSASGQPSAIGLLQLAEHSTKHGTSLKEHRSKCTVT
jgi:hypothetical protein